MDEQPRNVKELLVEAKDASELMVDLAYAAVFFNDENLAEEVEVLDLRHADEIVGRVRVREGAPCVGRSLKDLLLPMETGMWLLAVRRGSEWEFDPQAETVLNEGDVLLFQGPEEGVNLIREVAGAPPLPESPDTEGAMPLTELDRAVDILIEMKNSAEVAVGLAYSSLLFKDRALAAEVATLEARSDTLHDELESWVLKAAPEARNPDELRGLLRLAYASESIFDAARDMTWLVEHGEELHPVVQMALEETEEVVAETVVEPGSRAEGRSLKQLQLETETGMFVLALQRGRRWIYRPRPRFELEAGDRVISIGPEDGISELETLVRAPETAPA